MKFPVGIITDSFRTDIRTALHKAASLGADGVQIYAVRGDVSPEMTPAARARLRDMVASEGLVISALCGDLGTGGFCFPENNARKVEYSKRIVDLAKELGTDIITTHIGVVPADPAHPRFGVMQQACGELAEYAASVGAHFAVETGPEPAKVLKAFLDTLPGTGVAVNLDPANLKMVCDDDPAEAVRTLRDYIVHTHAKDGRMIYYKNPEYIYGLEQEPIVTDTSFEEVPLGQGNVNFPRYLKALEEIGFKGFLTIEREVGDDPAGDIAAAVDFLRKTMAGID